VSNDEQDPKTDEVESHRMHDASQVTPPDGELGKARGAGHSDEEAEVEAHHWGKPARDAEHARKAR
jgi:hypothetical protein